VTPTRDGSRETYVPPPCQLYPSICRFIESRLGLSMDRGTLPGALERFVKRKMSELRITDETTLANVLSGASETLLTELIEAVTVPYSWLFRDYEQLFDAVDRLENPRGGGRPLQVWVPACATGEDAYSISAIARLRDKRAEVLATDINSKVVERAGTADFGAFSARSIPARHEHQMTRTAEGHWSFTTDVCELISVAQHNLVEAPPRSAHAHGGWDLIVCRNVLIYFARVQLPRVLGQLRRALSPNGLLVLGASDIVLEPPLGLDAVDLNGRLAFKVAHQAPKSCTGANLSESYFASGGTPESTLRNASAQSFAKSPLTEQPLMSACPGTRDIVGGTFETLDNGDGGTDGERAIDDMLEGIVQYLSGEMSEAAQLLRAALFHCANLWPAAYYLALCYDNLGRFREAQREYQRTFDLITRRVPIPAAVRHDYVFLERDILGMVKRRALGKAR